MHPRPSLCFISSLSVTMSRARLPSFKFCAPFSLPFSSSSIQPQHPDCHCIVSIPNTPTRASLALQHSFLRSAYRAAACRASSVTSCCTDLPAPRMALIKLGHETNINQEGQRIVKGACRPAAASASSTTAETADRLVAPAFRRDPLLAESYDRCIVLIRGDKDNSYLCLEVPVRVRVR